MKFLIFSDLDGTFLNLKTYSFGTLKKFINKLDTNFEIIFVSSKTYEEITQINKYLNINPPFIVENGACIFFPLKYFEGKEITYKFLKYKNHLGFPLTTYNSNKIKENFNFLRNKYKFSFYDNLSNKKISKITNLKGRDVSLSKSRKFSNPIYWEDTKKKRSEFIKEVKEYNKKLEVRDGGRFLHILDSYDKGVALKKFFKIKNIIDSHYISISLGDSENDIPMLELTDYACIIKSKKNTKLTLKNKNIFRSKLPAPEGWKESIENILKGEKYF